MDFSLTDTCLPFPLIHFNFLYFSGIQREGRRAGHRVWHQIHGDLGQSLDKRRRGLHHVSQGYQGQNGKETGKLLKGMTQTELNYTNIFHILT